MRRQPSIKSRLLTGILALIGVAFLAIFIVFNISVREYIEDNARDEIEAAMQAMRRTDFRTHGFPQDDDFYGAMRGNRQPNPIGAEAQFFLWDGTNVLGGEPNAERRELEQDIAEHVRVQSAQEEPQTVSTDDGTFLVQVVLNNDEQLAAVLYVDVTDMQNFARTVNFLLIVILAAVGSAAVLVSIALASSIARPFQQLAAFARQIGNNDFSSSGLRFRDREPSELLTAMNSAAAKLQAYDRDQKTFFQNVSHELKTPLMTIRCNAEGVAFHVMEPEKSAGTIMRETDRLGEMIDDLLYISKADMITTSDVFEECDVREILSNCVESQRAAADKRGIEVVCDFSETPVVRSVSEKSLHRAMSNLVSNAIRYAKKQVVLTCAADGNRAVVRVWNDGPEIEEKDLPHIFERFYKGAGGQSGIGLSIVKSVVEKLGGSVSVETSTDGTQFTAEF